MGVPPYSAVLLQIVKFLATLSYSPFARSGASRYRYRSSAQVPGHGWRIAHVVWGRRGVAGSTPRGMEHGEAVELAGGVHLREQQIRHGHGRAPALRQHAIVHARGSHTGDKGKNASGTNASQYFSWTRLIF